MEMAQWLSVLAALPEDLGSIASTHLAGTVVPNSSSGYPIQSSGLSGPHMHVVQIHMQAKYT